MHWHRRQVGLVGVAGCLVLGGAAAALALSTSASGSTQPAPPSVQIDSAYCNESGVAGHARHGSCTFTLTDGRRFVCPLRFGTGPRTPASLERARACRPLTPLRIPAAWKPIFNRLYAAQACLARHGVTARGGPDFTGDPRRVPIGELDVAARPLAIIAFYATAEVARRAEAGVISAVRRTGGRVQRHGAVTIAWMRSSAPGAAVIDSCAFA